MKYVFAVVLVVIGVAIGVGLSGSPTRASLTRDSGLVDVQPGDEVRLYLDRARSGSQVFLAGQVVNMGADQYCLRQVEEVPLANHPEQVLRREVLTFVPRSTVLYVERAAKEQVVPTTQPG